MTVARTFRPLWLPIPDCSETPVILLCPTDLQGEGRQLDDEDDETSNDAFSYEKQVFADYLALVIYHQCFIVEFKSPKCTIEGAQLRPCLSGAAMAKAMREVKENARIIDGDMTMMIVALHSPWCWSLSSQARAVEIFHKHFVNDYGSNFEIGAKELRHDNEAHWMGRKPEDISSHRPLDQDSRRQC